MIAYLDNSATTKPLDEVVTKMNEINTSIYANPSSLHSMGFEAEKVIRQAKANALSAIGGTEGSFVFTSGGTESNNLAILGTVYPALKRHPKVVTSKIEHPSVLEPCAHLESLGATCEYIGVDKSGLIDMNQLQNSITSDTVLVSIMLVNNEVGAKQPIGEISRIIKSIKKDIIFHVDAVQAFGKIPINVNQMGIDLLSVSAHKINGPMGVGGLYIRKGVSVKPIVFGGHQENNLRSGTQNVPAIGGFDVAITKVTEGLSENTKRMYSLKNLLIIELTKLPYCHLNGGNSMNFAPHIVNFSFEKIKSEVLLHTLERHGVFISTGSACSSNKPSLSGVLLAMGVDRKLIDCAIRISMCAQTTEDEIIYATKVIKKETEELRRVLR